MEPKFALMVEGKSTPSKLHDTFDEAQIEATRLARIERKDVYVLKVVAKAEIADIKITHY
jgi:hypothetical protein